MKSISANGGKGSGRFAYKKAFGSGNGNPLGTGLNTLNLPAFSIKSKILVQKAVVEEWW